MIPNLIIYLYNKNKSVQTIIGINIRFSCLIIIWKIIKIEIIILIPVIIL
jgi:hypothetical protein